MSNTTQIIISYKEQLKRIGITPQKIIRYGIHAEKLANKDRAINIIIVSNDLKDIHICKRLEILYLAAKSVSERIEAIGYTEKEFRDLRVYASKKKVG